MDKLELLEILYCHKSLEFPNIQANMESLVELNLNGIGIEGLLSSIGERCTSLISLQLYNCFRIPGSKQPGEMLLPQCLQRLDLVNCSLEDGEIPPDIGEMSNLQELNLTSNNFSKLHFSISQLTRLKLLNLCYCERLLELPQLPSSLSILVADYCDSLTDMGDFYMDCKRLRYASLISSNIVIDGKRLLQSMLQGENAENQCVTLQLQGLEIAKGFTPCLRDGKECTLQLPENWCSDYYCGFLMCIVWRNMFTCMKFQIFMKQVITGGSMGMDSVVRKESDSEDDDVVWKESDSDDDDVVPKESDYESDVDWKESVCDEITWVGYIPFASLRHTNWWDSTYKKDSSINFRVFHPRVRNEIVCSGFGVRLVGRKGVSGPTETSEEISTDSSGISDGKDDYTTGFEIKRDSKDYLEISPRKF